MRLPRFRSLPSTLFALSALVTVLWAPTHAAEPALHYRVDDPALTWVACPPFMPKGCGLAVLHGDPGKPNVDVFFRIPAKAEIPSHWHTSAERMMLVEGVMQVEYNGQAPLTLRPGGYAYGPAKAPHRGVCLSASPCVLLIAFEAPLDAHPLP
jgi:quercetin dioxygenase-like cupin family protein